jgi:AraC-like DNA-binding protein
MTEFPDPSVVSSWARTIVDAFEARGADPLAVLEDAGFTAADLEDPNARHSISAMARLWRAAVARSSDPAFGLEASRHVRQTTFHALGYSVMASATVRDALVRIVRFSRLMSDAGELRLESDSEGERLALHLKEAQELPAEAAIDAVVALLVRTIRALTTRSFAPRHVSLRRSAPDDPGPYTRVFRCPVQFDAAIDAIALDPADLDVRLPLGDPTLARHNEEAVMRYLTELDGGSIVERVREAIAERLEDGEPSPSEIAKALGLSLRSLQRRLEEKSTSYASLLTDTRRQLATDYLRAGKRSVTEIAFLLGFADVSAFSRAFRRWFGVSPSEYRAK